MVGQRRVSRWGVEAFRARDNAMESEAFSLVYFSV